MVLHRLAGSIPVGPALHRGPRALESRDDLGDWNCLVDNQLRGLQTGARGQGCFSVRLGRAFLVVDTFPSPTQSARPSLVFTLLDCKLFNQPPWSVRLEGRASNGQESSGSILRKTIKIALTYGRPFLPNPVRSWADKIYGLIDSIEATSELGIATFLTQNGIPADVAIEIARWIVTFA